MKKYYILPILLLMTTKIFATHNISGEISFTHLSGLNFQVQIITYTKESAPADRPYLAMFYGDGTSDSLQRANGNGVVVAPDVKQNIYIGTHLYPGLGTYIIYFEDPNRDGGIINMPGSVNIPLYTESQLVISGTLGYNNSVQFLRMPVINGIDNSPLTHNVTAYDPDGDCLTFELIPCKGLGGLPVPGYTFPNFVAIDSINGEITWTNPALIGAYSFAVKVNEWRNGFLIGYVIRDFQVNILPPPPVQYYFSGNNAWQTDANGNYSYTLYPGDTLQLNLSYTDSFASIIDINAYSEVFSVSNPALFFKTLSLPTIGSVFSWITDFPNVRSAPYIVTFRGKSDDVENDISLLIYVLDAVTAPCLFPTSVAETSLQHRDIQIFPNPSSGRFTISGLEPGNSNHLLIYEVTGKLIKDIVIDNSISRVDASDIFNGFFIFELRDQKSVLTKGKFIKE